MSQKMRYRKRATHRRDLLTVVIVGDVRIVFITYVHARTKKTQDSELDPYRTSKSLRKNNAGLNLAVGSN
jgi:hypothetical protein